MNADIFAVAQAITVGVAVIAALLAVGWWIGGAVAGKLGASPPDIGDRTTGCVFAIVGASLIAMLLFVAYGIGAVILDALR